MTVNVMFKKISAKQGNKRFKERYIASIIKEYLKLHVMYTFIRVCPKDLTSKQKQYALRSITLIM